MEENSIFEGITAHPFEMQKADNKQYRWKVLNEKNPNNLIGSASEQYHNKSEAKENALSIALSIIKHYKAEDLK